jgi:hypothetical protein
MIEIDEYARRAVASPVAEPPEMAKLVALANRHRRRRRGVRATLALGVCAVVAAIVALGALPTDDNVLHVTATAPPLSTTATSSDTHELTISRLTNQLERAGHRVAADGTASGYPFGVDAYLLCVDGIQVRVYQYADPAARAAVSDGVSADGSSIKLPSTDGRANTVVVSWLWVGPPHFFARDRIIVLVLQDEDQLLHDLTRILGPTISPRALPRRSLTSPCATTP